MSEDQASANDGAGIWRDPSGIVTLGEQADNYVHLGHRCVAVCDSHRAAQRPLIARATGYRRPAKPATTRIPCPAGCGKMADLIVISSDGQ